MGKNLIIIGADFSTNGMVISQELGFSQVFASQSYLGAYTWIFSDRSEVKGKIKKVRVYSSAPGPITIKVFKSDFSLRNSAIVTSTDSNAWEEFDVNLDVQVGDYIGYFGAQNTGMKIPYSSNSGKSIYYVFGDVSTMNLDNSNNTGHSIQVFMFAE